MVAVVKAETTLDLVDSLEVLAREQVHAPNCVQYHGDVVADEVEVWGKIFKPKVGTNCFGLRVMKELYEASSCSAIPCFLLISRGRLWSVSST